MNTKYILHGGFKEGIKQENNIFFSEILKGTPQSVKVLIVYFATDNGEKYFPEDIEQFEKNGEGKNICFQIANEKEIEKQIYWADIVYLHGGSSLKIIEKMKQFPDCGLWLSNKIIAADSAGANLLSTNFYSKRNGVCEGTGILPIKFIPHFDEKNKDKLDNINVGLETVFLREYELKVIE